MVTPIPAAERLAAKLVRQPNGCLEWTGARNARGYGVIQLGGRGSARVGVHRLSWRLANPDQPDPDCIRHRCDNPPCCDPDHLEPGTIADNNRDTRERGRSVHPAGEANGSAVLTQANVDALRARVLAGESQRSVARAYGVHPSTVSRIVNGLKWRASHA